MKFLFIILALTTLGSSVQSAEFTPQNGVLDLSRWDLSTTIVVDGDWRFTNEKLLVPKTRSEIEALPLRALLARHKAPEPGFGTYILRIEDIPELRPLGILQGFIYNSSRMYWWGDDEDSPRVIYSMGDPNEDWQKSMGTYTPNYLGVFTPTSPSGYLILHYSANAVNDGSGLAGVSHPFEFGTKEKTEQWMKTHYLEVFFVIGLYALLGVYNIALFIQRPEDRGALAICFLAMGFAFRYLGTEGVPTYLYGVTKESIDLTGIMLTTAPAVAVLAMIALMHFLYPKAGWKKVTYAFMLPLPFMILFSAFSDFAQNMLVWTEFAMFETLVGAYCVFMQVRAFKQKEIGAHLGLFGTLTVIFAHVFDGAVTLRFFITDIYVGHYSMVVFILCQSLILGKRFAYTYKRTKILSEELHVKNVELVEQKNEIQNLNHELNEYNEKLEDMVNEKTRDIRSILASIRQGVVTINSPDGELGPERSEFFNQLFPEAKDCEQINVMKTCFEPLNFDHDQLDQIETRIESIVKETELAFIANAASFPAHAQREVDAKVQHLEFDWNPIINEETGIIEKLLLVIRDVTDIRKLQLQNEKQQDELQLIAELINIPPEKFQVFVESSRKLLEDNQKILSEPENIDDNINVLYRNLHTIKGMSRSYRLARLTEAVHLAENTYKDIKTGVAHTLNELIDELEKINHIVHQYEHLNDDKLGRSQKQAKGLITINKHVLQENIKDLKAVDISIMANDDRLRIKALKNMFFDMIYTRLGKVLEDQLITLKHVASDLGKPVPQTVFRDPGISFNQEVHSLLNNVFTHLIRNSIDHGIESPEDRVRKGKQERGTLNFDLSLYHQQVRIEYYDDGGGLNLRKVREKAIANGIIAEDTPLSQSQIAELVLHSGFSTAEKVSDISGRGVGLDAVKAFVEENNGVFSMELLENNQDSDCPQVRFIIILPQAVYQIIDDDAA